MSDTARFKQATQAMSAVYGSLEDVCSPRGGPSAFHEYYRKLDQARRDLEKIEDAASRLGSVAINTLKTKFEEVERSSFVCLCSQAYIDGAYPVPVSLRRCEQVRPGYLNIGRDRKGGDIVSRFNPSGVTQTESADLTSLPGRS
jgi:hypothetical protein